MNDDELEALSPEERARLEAAERVALQMLMRRMSEGRRTPRRHMRVAFVFLPVFVAVCAALAWIYMYFFER